MKTQIIGRLISGIPAAAAIICFFLLSSLNKPAEKNETAPAATSCCGGYTVPLNSLQKFMLDSLGNNQFEGGLYSKAALIAAINSVPGDSVYVLNILSNCSLAEGTDLAVTSPGASGVTFVRKTHCPNCPGRPCCRNASACIAKINRGCINYKVITAFAGEMGDGDNNPLQ